MLSMACQYPLTYELPTPPSTSFLGYNKYDKKYDNWGSEISRSPVTKKLYS